MKRKIILRLSFLIAFLTLLWSCRNEDFIQAEKNPQRNNRDFFKHSKKGGTFAKTTLDYVDILEAYNREKNFLSAMPDQEGMPIWDKMRIVKTENSTSLVIPLSEDNATMSSVFFALIDNKENTVKAINNITNDELRRVVFDPTIDVQKRESLFYTFMATDNYTFGNEVFTNIPQDLFVDDKLGEQNNRIVFHAPRFGDALVTETTTQNGRVQVVYEVICVIIRHCTHHGSGACDGCNICQTESCSHSTTLVFTYPDPETGVVIYGYPEGGGGGGTPLPIPDPDPCGLSRAFYRVAPNCTGNTVLEDPCKKLKLNLQKAKQMMDNSVVKAKNDAMTATIATDTAEKGMYWGYNSSGQMMTSNIFDMSVNYGGIPISSTLFTPIGSAHNHNGPDLYTNFSPADIIGFNITNHSFPTINHTFANGADGSLYVLTIESQLAYDDYANQYPMSTIDAPSPTNPHGTGDWKKGTDIRVEEDFLLRYFNDLGKTADEAMDLAMGYLIEKYNMGIMISKKGTDGNFHPIQVEKVETTDPTTGETVVSYQKNNPCNL
ncbi:hypothetical protein [Chryseobacterium gambrini]|uniref:Uncharacterized protein n=1 Tax=Chryseobacterium gambrini TaxID=373672 RepID=A0ABM8KCL9_9FLAO|nr:hypothetical protein CRDW_40660 [Chryseobacterium gambrini]